MSTKKFKTTDSGEREKFPTGAQRDTRVGKGRFDLLPVFALERDAGLLERGAGKYDARNWERGFKFSRCFDSAIRHLVLHLQGESVEDHLAAARFNIACVMHYEEMIRRGLMDPALNDLPSYRPVLPSAVLMPCEEQERGVGDELLDRLRTIAPKQDADRPKRNRAKCRLCSSLIESKYRHDYRTCDCGAISVDGGNDYWRWGAKDPNNFIRIDDHGQEVPNGAGDK